MTTTSLLYVTAGMIGLELLIVAIALARRGRFHWTSAGFWAWAAFALYFCAAPLAVARTGTNIALYTVRLAVAGGVSRGFWVVFVVLIGIGAFFTTYLHGTDSRVDSQPSPENPGDTQISLLGTATLLLFLAFGFYSLAQYRTFRAERDVLIVAGRFVGDVTGYQNSGYSFLFFPIAFLLISQRGAGRLLGWGLAALFLVMSLPHGWSRFTLVSMTILVSLASTMRSRHRWPSIPLLIMILLLAGVLQVRGHATWTYLEAPDLIEQSVTQAIESTSEILATPDTAMLATFYLESYVSDSIAGFKYGLPLINYALTGWIPYRIFPEKYFIVDWLNAHQGYVPTSVSKLLYGAKSSLLGDLYTNGWLVGAILGMGALGLLSNKLDDVLSYGDRRQKASALAILSQSWMIWGSSLTWGLIVIGFILVPALSLWITKPRTTIRSTAYEVPGHRRRLEI